MNRNAILAGLLAAGLLGFTGLGSAQGVGYYPAMRAVPMVAPVAVPAPKYRFRPMGRPLPRAGYRPGAAYRGAIPASRVMPRMAQGRQPLQWRPARQMPRRSAYQPPMPSYQPSMPGYRQPMRSWQAPMPMAWSRNMAYFPQPRLRPAYPPAGYYARPMRPMYPAGRWQMPGYAYRPPMPRYPVMPSRPLPQPMQPWLRAAQMPPPMTAMPMQPMRFQGYRFRPDRRFAGQPQQATRTGLLRAEPRLAQNQTPQNRNPWQHWRYRPRVATF